MFRYILTAAHCFEQVKHKTNVDVDITLGGCFSMLRINHLKIFLLNQVNMACIMGIALFVYDLLF